MLANKLNYGDTIGVVGVSNSISNRKERLNQFYQAEQFLIDKGLWGARPDLMLTGRTLMGHESAKNQQLEDHYFGAIPTRVMAFMKDFEYECWKLGIPVKTIHNEVSPNQF